MRIKFILLAISLSLVLFTILVVSAASISFEEADISGLGGVGDLYEVNPDSNGNLYLSHEGASRIHLIDPMNDTQTIYFVFENALDAKPDSSGNIWWTSGTNEFGVIDTSGDPKTKTVWEIGDWVNEEGTQLWGLEFDADGYVWISEWIGASSNLYRFDPSAELGETNLCTYTVSGGSFSSYYLIIDDETIWGANWEQQRVYRFTPSSLTGLWWQIPDGEAVPRGITLDGEGDFWWADHVLGNISELDPGTDTMTVYDLPEGSQPWMLAVNGGEIWYSEYPEITGTMGVTGTLGKLDPSQASGTTTQLTSGVTSLTQVCGRIDPIESDITVSVFQLSLTWAPASAEPLVEGNGLTVYQLPASSHPYGITVSNGFVWVTDKGDPNNANPVLRRNATLMRFPVSSPTSVYLPLILR